MKQHTNLIPESRFENPSPWELNRLFDEQRKDRVSDYFSILRDNPRKSKTVDGVAYKAYELSVFSNSTNEPVTDIDLNTLEFKVYEESDYLLSYELTELGLEVTEPTLNKMGGYDLFVTLNESRGGLTLACFLDYDRLAATRFEYLLYKDGLEEQKICLLNNTNIIEEFDNVDKTSKGLMYLGKYPYDMEDSADENSVAVGRWEENVYPSGRSAKLMLHPTALTVPVYGANWLPTLIEERNVIVNNCDEALTGYKPRVPEINVWDYGKEFNGTLSYLQLVKETPGLYKFTPLCDSHQGVPGKVIPNLTIDDLNVTDLNGTPVDDVVFEFILSDEEPSVNSYYNIQVSEDIDGLKINFKESGFSKFVVSSEVGFKDVVKPNPDLSYLRLDGYKTLESGDNAIIINATFTDDSFNNVSFDLEDMSARVKDQPDVNLTVVSAEVDDYSVMTLNVVGDKDFSGFVVLNVNTIDVMLGGVVGFIAEGDVESLAIDNDRTYVDFYESVLVEDGTECALSFQVWNFLNENVTLGVMENLVVYDSKGNVVDSEKEAIENYGQDAVLLKFKLDTLGVTDVFVTSKERAFISRPILVEPKPKSYFNDYDAESSSWVLDKDTVDLGGDREIQFTIKARGKDGEEARQPNNIELQVIGDDAYYETHRVISDNSSGDSVYKVKISKVDKGKVYSLSLRTNHWYMSENHDMFVIDSRDGVPLMEESTFELVKNPVTIGEDVKTSVRCNLKDHESKPTTEGKVSLEVNGEVVSVEQEVSGDTIVVSMSTPNKVKSYEITPIVKPNSEIHNTETKGVMMTLDVLGKEEEVTIDIEATTWSIDKQTVDVSTDNKVKLTLDAKGTDGSGIVVELESLKLLINDESTVELKTVSDNVFEFELSTLGSLELSLLIDGEISPHKETAFVIDEKRRLDLDVTKTTYVSDFDKTNLVGEQATVSITVTPKNYLGETLDNYQGELVIVATKEDTVTNLVTSKREVLENNDIRMTSEVSGEGVYELEVEHNGSKVTNGDNKTYVTVEAAIVVSSDLSNWSIDSGLLNLNTDEFTVIKLDIVGTDGKPFVYEAKDVEVVTNGKPAIVEPNIDSEDGTEFNVYLSETGTNNLELSVANVTLNKKHTVEVIPIYLPTPVLTITPLNISVDKPEPITFDVNFRMSTGELMDAVTGVIVCKVNGGDFTDFTETISQADKSQINLSIESKDMEPGVNSVSIFTNINGSLEVLWSGVGVTVTDPLLSVVDPNETIFLLESNEVTLEEGVAEVSVAINPVNYLEETILGLTADDFQVVLDDDAVEVTSSNVDVDGLVIIKFNATEAGDFVVSVNHEEKPLAHTEPLTVKKEDIDLTPLEPALPSKEFSLENSSWTAEPTEFDLKDKDSFDLNIKARNTVDEDAKLPTNLTYGLGEGFKPLVTKDKEGDVTYVIKVDKAGTYTLSVKANGEEFGEEVTITVTDTRPTDPTDPGEGEGGEGGNEDGDGGCKLEDIELNCAVGKPVVEYPACDIDTLIAYEAESRICRYENNPVVMTLEKDDKE